MNVNEYLKKCLELSERASSGPWYSSTGLSGVISRVDPKFAIDCTRNDAELIAFSRTALPKVCEALKILMDAHMEHESWCDNKRISTETCNCMNSDMFFAMQDACKLFDDADGG